MNAKKIITVWLTLGMLFSSIGFTPTTAFAQTTNLALNKPVTASSQYNTTWKAANAVDGNTSTRWDSIEGSNVDPQWIYVDLQATYNITHVKITWEAAYGKAYQIQTSPDATTWTTIYSTTTGDGGFDDMDVTGSGRYVRMNGTVRGTGFGYSLWEFGIYQ